MAFVFPKWTNRLPRQILLGTLLVGTTVTAGVWYYFTPKYTRVGYEPLQPVAFSHRVHVEQLGMDCRYCHYSVEHSQYANIPSSQLCLNCHNQVLKDDPRLALVRASAKSGRPIPWVQVTRLPDYVYFNHAVHVDRGISCVECHGPVNHMTTVYDAQPLSMSFCLKCHRNPAAFLRPPKEVYNLDWKAPSPRWQLANGNNLMKAWRVQRLQNCASCHR